MGLVVLGLLLVVCKGLGLAWLTSMPWWGALAPFGVAVLWWKWSDASGRTQRVAVERHERRAAERRDRIARQLRTGIRAPGKGQARERDPR